MLKELVEKNRSYRRFYQEKRVTREVLEELVDLARKTPSSANRQPNRYALVHTEAEAAQVFPCLRWAAYLKDWAGPKEGERPAAYILLLAPQGAHAAHDEGIRCQTILLGAVEKGLGGCILGSVDRERLHEELALPKEYVVTLVIALGYPKEQAVMHDVRETDDRRYYRDEQGVQHVPKLCLQDVIIK